MIKIKQLDRILFNLIVVSTDSAQYFFLIKLNILIMLIIKIIILSIFPNPKVRSKIIGVKFLDRFFASDLLCVPNRIIRVLFYSLFLPSTFLNLGS